MFPIKTSGSSSEFLPKYLQESFQKFHRNSFRVFFLRYFPGGPWEFLQVPRKFLQDLRGYSRGLSGGITSTHIGVPGKLLEGFLRISWNNSEKMLEILSRNSKRYYRETNGEILDSPSEILEKHRRYSRQSRNYRKNSRGKPGGFADKLMMESLEKIPMKLDWIENMEKY